MAKVNVYHATGFYLLSMLNTDGLKTYRADTDNIVKGDVLHDDGTGYATNAVVAFTARFLGIANEDFDNRVVSGGALSADNTIQVIPPEPKYRFIVPVEQNADITIAAVGLKVNLESCNTIDISDVATVLLSVPGFKIDEHDLSAEAVVANAHGYAIGHFVNY